MITEERVSGYRKGKLTVFGTVALIGESSAYVIRPETGTGLAMDLASLSALRKQEIQDDLAFTMVQRGLASYDRSRDLSAWHEDVRPEFFLIDLTKTCNLSCRYCFREFEKNYPVMTEEMIDEISSCLIAYWREHPYLKLSLQPWGGEPLICLPLIRRLRRNFDRAGLFPKIMIETNGTLITEETAAALKEDRIDIGISIDGNAVVHDLQRPLAAGGGSLRFVEQGVDNLRKAGYSGFGTITVVTENTIRHLSEVLEYFANLHVRSIKLNMMRRNSRNLGLAPDPKEFGGYLDSLLGYLYRLYQRHVPIVEQNIAQRLLNLVHRPDNNICNAHGCHGGYRMLSFDSLGKIFPCELSDFPDYCIGSVKDHDLRGMVEKAIESGHEYFRPKDQSECKDCPWRYFCRGGCRSAAKFACGDPSRLDTTECAFNKALYPRLVAILLQDRGFAEYLQSGDVE